MFYPRFPHQIVLCQAKFRSGLLNVVADCCHSFNTLLPFLCEVDSQKYDSKKCDPFQFLFGKPAPPLAFAAHSFFRIPPPQKIRMERSGKARRRADARYSARGAGSGNRSVHFNPEPPRTRSVRSGFEQRLICHRRSKLPNQTGRSHAAPPAQRATILLAAKRRIGSAGGIRNAGICLLFQSKN